MPRIIRILNRLAVGGPVLNASYLTKYMAPEYETLLVVGELEGHEKSADYLARQLNIEYVTIEGMGRSVDPLRDYGAYHKLRKLMQSFKPDVVHTHAAKPGALGRLAAASLNVPAIVHTFHGHIFHSYFNSAKSKFYIQTERYLGRKSDAIIAISEQQRQELTNDFKIAPADKFKVIPLGFDLDKFREKQEEKRKLFRQEFGLEDDVIAIGIIGRLVPVKNHELFLKAFAYVNQATHKKVRAFIVGDGESRPELKQYLKSTGMGFTNGVDTLHNQPVVFTSWRNDIDVVNAGLDIICLTSFNEGTPVSLIEAQAANKPVVSTRVGGISDIVVEGSTALLSEVQDTEQFCRNLLRLVEDDDLRNEMSISSHEHVFSKFSYQRLIKDMKCLYHDLLNKKTN